MICLWDRTQYGPIMQSGVPLLIIELYIILIMYNNDSLKHAIT